MQISLTIAGNGRIVIPADIRAQLGLKAGDKLVARIVDGAVVLEPLQTAIRRAQSAYRKYVPAGVSLSAELAADRRRAAADE
ncbi:MAG: AbrB/MazE/SpoVT family DNA-binding domain-containing protein [Alphaproteobacteria bacterium]|nr:AbrB/MazE/SpoVT family DNA-binding domain-containing protein [Alphaproteobacteria bacterium]